MNRPVGVFDSGVGGLTVVKELLRHLPRERIVYFGDTARVPYGTKSKQTVIRFSLENVLFLLKCNAKLILVACNTASSVAIGELRRHFRVPILGVIEPGAKQAVRATKIKRIGVIGTRATIASGAYEKEIKKIDPEVKVASKSCPLFVPLIEEGWIGHEVTFKIAEDYLHPLKQEGIDTLILGCTHYPLLKSVIKRVIGDGVTLIDSARQVALEARKILKDGGLCATKRPKQFRNTFYVTDEPEMFAKLGRRFLGRSLKDIRRPKDV